MTRLLSLVFLRSRVAALPLHIGAIFVARQGRTTWFFPTEIKICFSYQLIRNAGGEALLCASRQRHLAVMK
jgi:hypothetical protein